MFEFVTGTAQRCRDAERAERASAINTEELAKECLRAMPYGAMLRAIMEVVEGRPDATSPATMKCGNWMAREADKIDRRENQ